MSEHKVGKAIGVGFAVFAIGEIGFSGLQGAIDGVRDASLVQVDHTIDASTHVDLPPRVSNVESLNEYKFLRFSGAIAVTGTYTDNWTMSTNVFGQNVGASFTALHTSVYNGELVNAEKNKTAPNMSKVDTINVEMALGPSIEQTYRPSAKRVADMTDEEKRQNPGHILSYVIRGKDLVLTPVRTDNPLSMADSTVTTGDIPAKVVGALDSVKGIWGDNSQTYDEGASNATREITISAGVSTFMDRCGPQIMDSPQIQPLIKAAVKKHMVDVYNSTHTPDQWIAVDDVDVEVKDIDTVNFTSSWTLQVNKNIAERKAKGAAEGHDLIPNTAVNSKVGCDISETDLSKLNGGTQK